MARAYQFLQSGAGNKSTLGASGPIWSLRAEGEGVEPGAWRRVDLGGGCIKWWPRGCFLAFSVHPVSPTTKVIASFEQCSPHFSRFSQSIALAALYFHCFTAVSTGDVSTKGTLFV